MFWQQRKRLSAGNKAHRAPGSELGELARGRMLPAEMGPSAHSSVGGSAAPGGTGRWGCTPHCM